MKRKLEEEETENKKMKQIIECPYLDTINRKLLDFDLPKVCCESISNLNIYCCLVCGKFYQGRGPKTPAYYHALQNGHHVYVNLVSKKFYCLPDDYEFEHPSLYDIKFNIDPKIEVSDKLDKELKISESLLNVKYIPGYIGLNNLKKTDSFNSVIQALTKLKHFRNFLLSFEYRQNTPLLNSFSELTKKIWNPYNFKNHVSPAIFLDIVENLSSRRFKIGNDSDPFQFLIWLLNTLHEEWCGSKSLTKSSPIIEYFSGQLLIKTQFVPIKSNKDETFPIEKKSVPFLNLSMELPQMPLFKDKLDKRMIPEISLYNVFSKYDGCTETLIPHEEKVEKKLFSIEKIPEYLIIHYKRFSTVGKLKEKNLTIVNFPVKSLNLTDFCKMDPNIKRTKYDLVANICHEGSVENGSYKVHIWESIEDKYIQLRDLEKKENILPQEISQSESYLQFFKRREED